MNILFNIAQRFTEPMITINASEKTPDLVTLAVSIDRLVNQTTLIGYQQEQRIVVPLYRVIRFYTQSKVVMCETADGVYRMRERLYELRDRLSGVSFIAISSSEIVSKMAIESFSLTKQGSYQIHLITGDATYTSRRYMKNIREAFLK